MKRDKWWGSQRSNNSVTYLWLAPYSLRSQIPVIVPFAFFLYALLRRQSSSPYPLRGRAIDALVLFICRACEILYKEVKCKLRVLYLYRSIWSLGFLKMLYTSQLPVVKCITKSTYVGNFVFIPCTTLFDHVFPHTT